MMVIILDDDEILLRNHEVFTVHLVKNLGLENFRGGGGGEESGFEKDQSIHPRANHINVVRDKEDREFELVMKVLYQLDDIVLSGDIQTGRRFIQYQDLGLLGQCPGDENALLLAAGQMPESMIFMRFHSDLSQSFQCDVMILPPWTFEQAKRSVTTHHHRFEDRHRKISIDDPFLRKVADFCAMVAAELITGAVEDMKMALHWSEKPQDGAAKRRLA